MLLLFFIVLEFMHIIRNVRISFILVSFSIVLKLLRLLSFSMSKEVVVVDHFVLAILGLNTSVTLIELKKSVNRNIFSLWHIVVIFENIVVVRNYMISSAIHFSFICIEVFVFTFI